jgi:hypothetical protein
MRGLLLFIGFIAVLGFGALMGVQYAGLSISKISTEQERLGLSDAPVTIVHYYDFLNAGSRRMYGQLLQLRAQNPNVNIVIRPLPQQKGGEVLARMAIAGRDLNLYEAFYNRFMRMELRDLEQRPEVILSGLNVDGQYILDHMYSRKTDMILHWNKFLAWTARINNPPALVIGDEVINHDALSVREINNKVEKLAKAQQ